MADLKTYPVWDRTTRLFHWINFACITGLAGIGIIILNEDALGLTNDALVILKTTHVTIGYVFVVNLLWRLVWAFIGNRYARWASLLPAGSGYLRSLREYTAGFFSVNLKPYLGHSPPARIGVTVLLLLLCVQAATGLVIAGTDLFYPPFGGWIAAWVAAPGVDPATLVPYSPEMYDLVAWQEMRDFRAPILQVHIYNFYILLITIAAHIAAVVVTEIVEGGSIVSAMINGKKTLRGEPEDGPGV